jgi:hypothetical protein
MRFSGVLSVLIAAAAIAGSVYAGQAEDPVAKAATILAEARKALGGADKLAAIQRLEAKGTVRRAAGDVNIEGDLEIAVELPGKYLRKESIILGGGGQGLDRTEALNGNEAWEEMKFGGGVNFDGDFGGGGGGGGPRQGRQGAAGDGRQGGADQRQVDPERQKELQLRTRQTEVARVLLATLLASETPAKWIGTAVSPQATAEVLEITTADGTPTRLLLDSKTYMPLMLTWTGVAQDPLAALAGRAGFGRGRGGRGGRGGFGRGGFPGGQGGQRGQQGGQTQPGATEARADALSQPTTLRMFLSEYKAVNGVKLPHLLVRGAGDQVTEEWVIRNYRINPNFKADTFSK